MRITSTPANGTHYVAGEAITTRLDLPAHLHSGNPATSQMKLDIGARQRRAASTTPYSFALAGVNYSYTVVADDVDTDGIAIPANAIVVSGQPWRTAGSRFINLNNAALSSQSAHKVIGSTAYISATNPSPLTEASLNGATVTVALDGLTYASGVTDSDFLLATTVQNLSIASVGSVSSGDTAATLTLAFTGDTGFELDGTLAASVAASAHSGTSFLTTGSVPVLATDTAPSFGSGSVADKSYRPGMAITEFQVPAATGGNGALTYSASNLPTGLVFDADGTGACPGTEPREICGTPTTASGAHPVTITVTDADTNTAASDAATLTFQIAVTGATLASAPTPLTEANLNGARLTVGLLGGATFTGVSAASFELVTAPAIPGLSIGSVTGGASGSSSATLTLATGAGYGFSTQATIAVRALAAAHSGTSNLVSDALAVSPTPGVTVSKSRLALDEAPGASNANQGTYTVALDSPLTGCGAGVSVNVASNNADVTSNPTTLNFTANNWSTPQTVTVTAAHDADYTDDTATISHGISVACAAAGYTTSLAIDSLTVTVDDDEDPTASISSTSPAALTEANLHSAQITVALTYATFGSGVTTSSFELVTDIPSASVALVSNVSSGDTTATLTLAFTGDFSAVETLAVKVKAAAHTGSADITTGTVTVTPTPGIALSRASLALEEDPAAGGATNANVGTYTVALAANPRTAAGGSCPVIITATSNNADVIIDTDTSPLTKLLTFDQTDWDTPQTVTVTARHDADGVDAAATISHSRTGGVCVGGFFGTPSLPALTVAVNDDETPTAAIASPSILTAATLNNATVSVSLSLTTFASGVGPSSFELVTGVTGLSISATATYGGTNSTLTLSHSGTLAADAKLAVKVLAAAHAGDADLTTGQIDVLVAADTAPSFGGATVPAKFFAEGEAIAPFQIPAASGGNGAIDYGNTSLPAGLKFDATGTDAGGCAASDFPPGTADSWAAAPRTVCGTPTATGWVSTVIEAHDADSNRDDDRALLNLSITVYGASITSTSPSSLAEANLNGATVSLSLAQAAFASGVAAASFELVTAIPGVSVSSVSGVTTGGTTATLTLAFTGDFSASRTLAVKVKAAAHNRDSDVTTAAVTVFPTGVSDTAPTFGSATVPAKFFPVGAAIAPFQIPAASGGNGAIDYGNTSLPAGLKFDATGTDAGGCAAGDFPPGTADSWAAAPRTVCGTPTATGWVSTVIEAHDADSNRDDDRALLNLSITVYGASITSTSPSSLAEANLNGATVSLSLAQATFASGVTAASFELVTAIPGLSVSQVSGVTTGGTTATLTLAFTGDFSASRTLAVKVKAAAHNRDSDVTTAAVTVFPTGVSDTAPTFGGATVPAKFFPVGAAIAPFQIPAASGGNGAIDYGNTSLPAGLKFDATGTDAGGCAAGDFPPGTADSWAAAPRTVCGTPTATGWVSTVIEAHDADSNRDDDRALLNLSITVYGASITSTSPSSLAEANLNGATVSLSLAQATFASGVTAASFELVTAIPGLSVSQVSGVTTGVTTATLTLAFTGDFSAISTLAVRVKAAAHSRAFDLTTGAVTVAPTDTEPAFAAVADRGFPTNVAIAPFRIPAATGGNGALGYAVAGLPDGLKFDLTGTDAGGCAAADFPPGTDASWATAPRTICGTPTRDVTSVVVVTGTDEDGDVARLTLRVTVAAPAAVLGDTVPAALSEANLHGATVIVALVRTAFASGVTAASFQPVTTIPGLSVSSVSSVAEDDTQATLTLAFTGDFGGTRDLAVKVLAAAHTGSADLTTGTAPVTASPGVTLSRDSLALNEAPGTNNANRGAYTVALAAVPTGCTGGVGVAVASDNADVTVNPSTLTFTASNWNTAQTVTVTAAQDDADSNDDVATLSHRISTACTGAGYPATLAIGSVTVTVADDEVGAAIVPTPATLTEANLNGATLALSLVNTTFVSGVTAASFEPVTAIPNVSVSQVSGITTGGTTATLTLAFTGDFRGQPTLAVRIPAASHQGAGVLTSNAVAVTAAPGVTVSETGLALEEDPTAGGATNANVGTYTIVPDSPPTGCAAGVGIAVASDNADVTANPAALTFTASNWNTARTVTVTAAQDDDGVDDAATLSHSVGTACDGAGYPASFAIGGLSVAVDDDETPAVVVDADPSTANVADAGPLTLTEGHATDAAKTYSVKLATEPTQTVTVTLTSADADAVSIDDTDGDSSNGVQNTLTFTSSTWGTARTVTARAADDADATDESVALAHTASTATASEYTPGGVGVSASLTATVADDDALAAPGNVRVSARVLALRVQWDAVTGADGYKVQWKSGSEGYDAAAREAAATGTSHTVSNLAAGTAYTLRVLPTRAGANDGPASAEATGTPLAVPTLAIDSPGVAEGDSGTQTLTFTVSLSHASQHQVTVAYADAGTGTATSGTDYTALAAGTLTFAAGATTGTIDVDVTGDALDEADETIAVTLSTPVNATLSATATGTGTITDDDDAPTVSIDSPSVAEGTGATGGTLRFTVSLSAASGRQATVAYARTGGTATSGTDYTALAAGTLTFAAGTTTRTIDVTVTGDATDEPDETVVVTLSAPTNATLATAAGTGTVTDDDAAPTVSIDSPSVAEGTGATGGTLRFTVGLSAASGKQVTVAYADAGTGTATSGTDYTALTAGTLTFAAGTTARTIDVAVTGDATDESDETVAVTLSTPVNATLAAAAATGTGTVTDDDTAGFAVSPATTTTTRLRTTESGGTATFTVALASEPTGDVVLGVTSSNTAEGMVSPSSLTFTATNWNTAQTVTLTGVDDSPTLSDPNPSAGDRNYTVTLTVNTTSTADTNYDALASSPVTVYAVNADNEYGLNVGSVAGQATEAEGTATFTVALITQPSQAVTVSVTSLDASEGAASPSSLTFATTAWNTAVTVTVTGADDAIDDGTVTWAVRLDPSSGDADYDGLANVDVSVTTTDDDAAPGVTLALSPASISESGAGNVSTVTATLSHPSSAATTVTVTPVTGFYTVGSDTTIVIAAGETANATDTVTIAAVDNDTDAPDRAGTVTATITNDRATADGTTMAVSGGALTIGDDDAAPNATLSLNPSSVSENGGAATVTATLSHPSSAATTVTVTPVSGSYTVGSDATIVIAAGETANATDTAAIAAADNTKDEPDRTATVTATLTNSQGAGTVSGATLTLTDDDAAPGVTLAVSPASISENGGAATVTATLSHPSSAATTVTVTAVTGSYTVGSDATIAIAAGSTTSTDTVTITAVDNDVDAADNAVTVAGTAQNSQGTGTVTGASLTIANDDDAGLVVSPATSTTSRLRTTESGGTAAFTVKLSSKPTGDVVLGVASTNTAEGMVSPSSLTFTAMTWNTAQTVTLTGVDDAPANPADGNQDYTVTLTVNTTSTLDDTYDGLSAVTVYAVNADNEYGLALVPTNGVTGTVTEGGGQATFTVALVTQPSAAVTVSVTSLDANGRSEGTVSPSSLTFTATDWSTARTVTVTGADDDWDDGTVTWAVRLDTSSGGDPNYDDLDDVDVPVTTTDNDDAPTATLVLTPSTIDEGGTADTVATVTATLSRRSVAATTITVTASPVAPAVAGDYTLSAATIVIAAGSISSSTVTIAANDNDVAAADKTVTVSGTAANDRAAADLEAVAVTSATLTIRDNDEKGFAFDPAEFIEVTEGNPDGTGYTVALTSEPVGTVTVTVSGHGRVTASPTTLKFAAIADSANSVNRWDAAQAVTVTATDDGNDYAEPSSVSHTASGGDYGGVSGSPSVSRSLPVSVKDETAVRTDGASTKTKRIYFIEGREVEVTVGAGVPKGIVVDFKGVKAVAAATTVTMSISQDVPTATVERAKGDGFNLGPKESRRVVNIKVENAPGVRVCLPVNAAVVDGARDAGRLRLLRDDRSVWAPVERAEEYDAAMARICAPEVKSFGPFATGYVDTTPAFGTTDKPALVFTVDETGSETLPEAAKTGDGGVTYSIKERLPAKLGFAEATRTISGMPTAAQDATDYTLVATDADGDEGKLTFSIEVKPALAEARARLKAINESVLPELSRALWGSALDAVTGRLESPDAAAPTAAAGLEAAATFARANESALEEGDVSWKELLGGESFAFGLAADGEDGPGAGGVVAWGSGDWRRLSRDEDLLDWSGDAFSAHLGVDAALRPDLRAGLAASWFSSDMDYTDRSQGEAIAGSHESRMTALTPYLGWAAGGGTRLWGAAGYGWGEIEIVDADLRERFGAQKADSRFLAGAAGGSVPVWSQGSATLKAKGSAEATRWRVKDNGAAIAAVSVDTQRLRLAAEGSQAYALPDGTSLTPTLEAGVRWDGGDGATGMGLEAGGGLSWTDPARGLTMEAEGRALVAHNKDIEEWGASGSMRLDPGADGFGLSFRLLPSWGASGSGVARLWDEGVAAARPADGGGGNEARLETELGYGLPAFGGAGVTTPYAGFGLAQGGERGMRAGVRLGLGAGFDLGVEAERREGRADAEHGVGLELRIRW